jgi:8-oxo-dGTP diphosphatase
LKEIFVVAGIFISHDKSILLAQRSAEKSFPLQWEFPGGKIEEGENSESALKRELFEELNIEVNDMKYFDSVVHEYELFRANIEFFLINEWSGKLLNKEGQNLRWTKLNDLKGLKILDADMPVINKIITIYD